MHKVEVGKLVTEERNRDAIHVAVVPVKAGVPIKPGERVHLLHGVAFPTSVAGLLIAVADPFLERTVEAGETFWLFLKPGEVENLRHDWDHDEFPHDQQGVEEEGHEEEYDWCRTAGC